MGALIGFLHTSAEALNPRHILWDKTSARHHIITTKLTEGLSSPTLPHQPPSASYTPELGTGLHHSGPRGRQTALPTASFQDFSIYPSLSPLERKDGDWELGSQFIQIQNPSVYYSADKKSSPTGELNFQKILQWQNLISRQVNGKHLEKTKSSSNNLKKLYATIGKQTLLVCVGTKHDKEKSLLCQLMPYMPYNTQDPVEKRTASADKDDD